MSEANLARLRTHRANIGRYHKLLATRLTELERSYIERRLGEERASVEALLQETFPERLCLRLEETKSAAVLAPNLEMAALLHPADAFSHPMDIVEDCDLTTYEKQAILSAWAADACAVKDVSELSHVSFDEIVNALGVLDSKPERTAESGYGPGGNSGAQRSEHARAS
jgi:hypothetical protein